MFEENMASRLVQAVIHSNWIDKLKIILSLFLLILSVFIFVHSFWKLESITNLPHCLNNQNGEELESSFLEQQVTVDISGEVNEPGVYQLSEGSRVVDLVALAEGFTSQADTSYVYQSLNLASKLEDSQKVYIPSLEESFLAQENDQLFAVGQNKISINTASLEELMTLVGVGESRAAKIIENRPFSSIEELISEKIISQSIYEDNEQKIIL